MAAPMDGLTDSPFRQVLRDFSPDELLMTEMRHVSHVAHEPSQRSVKYSPIEQPLAFQFSANTDLFLPEAIEKVIQNKFVMINLNSGCPAKVVVRSGSGSALMANIPLLKKLLNAFYKNIDNRVPFTLKIRAGFKEKNAIDVAKLAQDCGVQGIIIHPRTQPEGFTSRLDYDLVKQIKSQLNIPVVFSGNINSFDLAKKVYELTGADGFMIGRALWGAPWKIHEIVDASKGKIFQVNTITALHCAIKHLNLNLEFYGENGFTPFKKQVPQYIRKVENAAQWRLKLVRSQSKEEMLSLLNQLINITSMANNVENIG